MSINIKDLFAESAIKNGAFILSLIPLFVGYYIQDNIFVGDLSKVLANFREFLDNLSFGAVADLMLPYFVSISLIYVAYIINGETTSKIKFDVVNKITDKLIFLNKNCNLIDKNGEKVNVDKLIDKIRNVTELKNIYYTFSLQILPALVVGFSLVWNFFCGDKTYSLLVILLLGCLFLITIKLEFDAINNNNSIEKSLEDMLRDIEEMLQRCSESSFNNRNDNIIFQGNNNFNEAEEEDRVFNKIRRKNNDIVIKEIETATIYSTNNYLMQIINVGAVLFIAYLSYKMYINGIVPISIVIANIILAVMYVNYYNQTTAAMLDVSSNSKKISELSKYFSSLESI